MPYDPNRYKGYGTSNLYNNIILEELIRNGQVTRRPDTISISIPIDATILSATSIRIDEDGNIIQPDPTTVIEVIK